MQQLHHTTKDYQYSRLGAMPSLAIVVVLVSLLSSEVSSTNPGPGSGPGPGLDHDLHARGDHSGHVTVQVKRGGLPAAKRMAEEHGFQSARQVRGFDDIFLLENHHSLGSQRRKRDVNEEVEEDVVDALHKREEVVWAKHEHTKRRDKRQVDTSVDWMFNDPMWPKMWHLHDLRPDPETQFKVDLHVIGAWKKGYTGKGVSVTILDDGIQKNHTDLYENYDPFASYDLNDDDYDPTPQFNQDNMHGTRCAGEVAMTANNSFCGVGIAYEAGIGGIRMLDGRITDHLEAEALQHNISHVDVMSASWGPTDDGKTVDGPGPLALKAIQNGIAKGRDGNGIIYVWASGNGGYSDDNCDCDGYADSIYTLSVSSASQAGQAPWYGERCASTITTTYSSGRADQEKIITTDLFGGCYEEFTGTSAAAPQAAGVVALALQANPNLTWRDVQHIAAWTAEPAPLMNSTGWTTNGRGLLVNNKFGFGLMNAEAFVTHAESWTNVPQQRKCTTSFPDFGAPKPFSNAEPKFIKFSTDGCRSQASEIRHIEHVQVVVTIEHPYRGALEIFVTSPEGTKTQLLGRRSLDTSAFGFKEWPFMSVQQWGENPSGEWTLEIYDADKHNKTRKGTVDGLELVIWGTAEEPLHYQTPRNYDMKYNHVQNRQDAKKKRYVYDQLESRSIAG